ncbi:glutathione S-transferase family protein [Massilia horti]|uniref:Glutathione S-transferase family protein n=1 Tax=Massilia horti TaxID=2562153 RepID=A0A4Y9T5M0_9BURK|nr:glutathione S-transferase family protein [Massilia horti]TFW35557.1 glutathione S-transferase family protein [Massilia horti]
MITLYTFGPALGLPDFSPFVMKAELLLKMSGLPYQTDTRGFKRAPKGKLPYIDDNGTVVADSTMIRMHLEQRHGVNFNGAYDQRSQAAAWAVEKMLEEHLYFALLHERWIKDENFERGPARFFDFLPAPLRPLVRRMVRGKIRKTLQSQGMGRHSEAEIVAMACRDLDALSALMGEHSCLLGEHPCAADATVLAFVAATLCEQVDTPVRTHAEKLPNLVAYRDRWMAHYYGAGQASTSALAA